MKFLEWEMFSHWAIFSAAISLLVEWGFSGTDIHVIPLVAFTGLILCLSNGLGKIVHHSRGCLTLAPLPVSCHQGHSGIFPWSSVCFSVFHSNWLHKVDWLDLSLEVECSWKHSDWWNTGMHPCILRVFCVFSVKSVSNMICIKNIDFMLLSRIHYWYLWKAPVSLK